jgi:hypothetical protein
VEGGDESSAGTVGEVGIPRWLQCMEAFGKCRRGKGEGCAAARPIVGGVQVGHQTVQVDAPARAGFARHAQVKRSRESLTKDFTTGNWLAHKWGIEVMLHVFSHERVRTCISPQFTPWAAHVRDPLHAAKGRPSKLILLQNSIQMISQPFLGSLLMSESKYNCRLSALRSSFLHLCISIIAAMRHLQA